MTKPDLADWILQSDGFETPQQCGLALSYLYSHFANEDILVVERAEQDEEQEQWRVVLKRDGEVIASSKDVSYLFAKQIRALMQQLVRN